MPLRDELLLAYRVTTEGEEKLVALTATEQSAVKAFVQGQRDLASNSAGLTDALGRQARGHQLLGMEMEGGERRMARFAMSGLALTGTMDALGVKAEAAHSAIFLLLNGLSGGIGVFGGVLISLGAVAAALGIVQKHFDDIDAAIKQSSDDAANFATTLLQQGYGSARMIGAVQDDVSLRLGKQATLQAAYDAANAAYEAAIRKWGTEHPGLGESPIIDARIVSARTEASKALDENSAALATERDALIEAKGETQDYTTAVHGQADALRRAAEEAKRLHEALDDAFSVHGADFARTLQASSKYAEAGPKPPTASFKFATSVLIPTSAAQFAPGSSTMGAYAGAAEAEQSFLTKGGDARKDAVQKWDTEYYSKLRDMATAFAGDSTNLDDRIAAERFAKNALDVENHAATVSAKLRAEREYRDAVIALNQSMYGSLTAGMRVAFADEEAMFGKLLQSRTAADKAYLSTKGLIEKELEALALDTIKAVAEQKGAFYAAEAAADVFWNPGAAAGEFAGAAAMFALAGIAGGIASNIRASEQAPPSSGASPGAAPGTGGSWGLATGPAPPSSGAPSGAARGGVTVHVYLPNLQVVDNAQAVVDHIADALNDGIKYGQIRLPARVA